jgi:hypothetical protein
MDSESQHSWSMFSKAMGTLVCKVCWHLNASLASHHGAMALLHLDNHPLVAVIPVLSVGEVVFVHM